MEFFGRNQRSRWRMLALLRLLVCVGWAKCRERGAALGSGTLWPCAGASCMDEALKFVPMLSAPALTDPLSAAAPLSSSQRLKAQKQMKEEMGKEYTCARHRNMHYTFNMRFARWWC